LCNDAIAATEGDRLPVCKNFLQGIKMGGNYAKCCLLSLLMRVDPSHELNLPPVEDGLGYDIPLDNDNLFPKIKTGKLLYHHKKAMNGHPGQVLICQAQCGLQTDGNPDVHDQHTEMPKPGKPTLEFEVILSLFSNLIFVNNNIGLLVRNGGLERVA